MGELHISKVVDRRGVAADDVLDVLRARIHDSRLLSHKGNVQRGAPASAFHFHFYFGKWRRFLTHISW